VKSRLSIVSFIVLITFHCGLSAQSNSGINWKDEFAADYKNFYSWSGLSKLALGIGYAGFYANTSFDQEIQNCYNDYLKSRTTDNISKIVKPFGDGLITVPVYLMAIVIGELEKDTPIGSTIGAWGQRCSRSILVGAPPVLLLQVALGASRPNEGKNSHWHPFKDNNGVSGHSFMGSVPFLAAAKMTDNRFLKYPLYVGSTLTGLSRINDKKHYFSQAVLGWWIAFLAMNSVAGNKLIFAPSADGIGVLIYF
jgi:hypothetical protein